jgi:hypothetical protein
MKPISPRRCCCWHAPRATARLPAILPVRRARLFNPEYDPDTFSLANGQIMADFAVARQKVTRGEAEAWIDDLSQLGREGRYFFSLNRYLFLATRGGVSLPGRPGAVAACAEDGRPTPSLPLQHPAAALTPADDLPAAISRPNPSPFNVRNPRRETGPVDPG